jgi:UDP-N-acetylmuramoyl-tripeptide--D-alanyl-D-alanine ligase
MSPKKIGKALLCQLLEAQVKRLRRRNDFMVVAVAGSAGKTSTKLAIAKTLAANKRVIYQDGNYNDRLTVPLILFAQTEPGIYNVAAWLKLLKANRKMLKQPYPYDIAVVEIGTDGPGQLKKFAYLRPDITVITAIADEHMEYFGSLDAVAHEELAPLEYSKQVLLNTDDIPGEYLPETQYLSYGLDQPADYKVIRHQARGLQGQQLTFKLPAGQELSAEVAALGGQGAKIAAAAVAAADLAGLSPEQIKEGLQAITPVSGRMQVLAGKQGSIIIDDTYNASPIAVKAALEVLYGAEATKRIAILGSMNELGVDSAGLHADVAAHCDPANLDLLVTIGQEANKYLAPAAEKRGCTVKSFVSPYQAGEYVAGQIKPGSVILAKGSQNGVFAEEALKVLLANSGQARKLVRQSDYWLAVKKQQFPNT